MTPVHQIVHRFISFSLAISPSPVDVIMSITRHLSPVSCVMSFTLLFIYISYISGVHTDQVTNATRVQGNKLHRNDASLLTSLPASDGLNHTALAKAIKIVSVNELSIPDNFEEQINDEKRLLAYLMRHYDSSVRPVRDSSSPVVIRLGITLTQIFDLDEKNQVLTTNIWLDQVRIFFVTCVT